MVAGLLNNFAAARPEDVTRRVGDTFVAVEAVPELIDEAKPRGIRVLGLEHFLVGSDTVYPVLSRIVDLSSDSVSVANDRAQELVRGQLGVSASTR